MKNTIYLSFSHCPLKTTLMSLEEPSLQQKTCRPGIFNWLLLKKVK